MINKKILYVDMDNVLVDFKSGIDQLDEATKKEYGDDLDDVPGIFSLMKPMTGAIEAVKELAKGYDIYILSTAPWKNPTAWSDKLLWIKKYFGDNAESIFHKRLIISHHKNLNHGDFLIDDRTKHGVELFSGEHIHFGSDKFPDWDAVRNYLLDRCCSKE
jgi:5'(3')-deoxyribonucleotidase